MKAGFDPRALGSVARVIAGQSPEGKFYNDKGDGLPFYQGKKEFGDRHIGPPTTWTTEVTKIAEPGDILMSVRAPVGPVNFTRDRICIGRGLAAIRTSSEISPNFLFYQLLYKQDAIAGTEGAVFASINKAGIESVQVVAPSSKEQLRIVTLLDEAFADIAKANANAEKNLQNAHELFESHLDAIVTNAQASGAIVPLSELTTDITDGDHMPPPKVEQGLPFITIGNIDKQTRAIDFSDTFQVSREYFDGLKANKKPKRGDVLYTVTGSFGIPVLVEDDKEFCFQRHIGLVRPKADVDSFWLHYLLQSPQVFNQAADGATGTAQKTVSLKVLRNLQVPKISPKEQLAHVEILRSLETESRRLESIYRQKLTALDALKKSLLHQAFSGQL